MKKVLFLLLFSVLFAGLLVPAQARLSAYFSYAAFDRPGTKPYLETYLQVSGNSVVFNQNEKGLFKGTLEVQWIYKKGDAIVTFDKYLLHSPEMDSLGLMSPADFLDVQRTLLDTGTFTVELTITDKYSDEQGFSIKQEITIGFPTATVSISDIELLERYSPAKEPGSFTKNGYNVYPFVMGFYPPEVTRLLFYSEIYRTREFAGGDVLVRYMISNNESKQLVNELIGSRKQTAADVIPLMAELPIDQLPSGNYQLTIEVRSRENKVLAYRQCFFNASIPSPNLCGWMSWHS